MVRFLPLAARLVFVLGLLVGSSDAQLPAVIPPGTGTKAPLPAKDGAERFDQAATPVCGTSREHDDRMAAVAIESYLEESETSARLGSGPTGFDVGDDLAVLFDTGNLSFGGVSISPRMAKTFARAHDDDFDILAIYNDFGLTAESGFAFHSTVTNEVLGTGRQLRDIAVSAGFPTQRLVGYLNLNSLTRYPNGAFDPVPLVSTLTTPVTILAHEFSHQWLSALRIEGFNILGQADLHWSFYLDSSASVMEGNRWRDNGDGTFTTVTEAFQRFGPLDQYAMGLRPAAQVPTQLLVTMHPGGPSRQSFPRVGVTTPGVPHFFEIEDIIAGTGTRVPGSSEAQHSFRMGTVVVVSEGTTPTASDIDRLNRFRLGFEGFFRAEADGRGVVRTRLQVPSNHLVHRFESGGASSRFGFSVAQGNSIGGGSDSLLWIGAPKDGPGCVTGFSATDGRPLVMASGTKRGDNFGLALLVLPDLTGDGVGEVAVGSPGADATVGHDNSGLVVILDGSDGSVLWSVSSPEMGAGFGRSLAIAADVDGLGIPDLIVGAPRVDGAAFADVGAVFIVSVETGGVLLRVEGADAGGYLGFSVASLGDVNGDGSGDFSASSPYSTSTLGDVFAGAVTVVSGMDGSSLFRVEGSQASGFFGASTAVLSDVTGDGIAELLVGEPGRTIRTRPGAGRVSVLSGFDGVEVLGIPGGGERAAFGAAISSAPDLDGDDLQEIVVGSPGASPGSAGRAGSVSVFSSRDGALLEWIEGATRSDGFGASVAAVSSAGGIRILAGSPGTAPSDCGSASVHEVTPFRLSTSGAAALGTSVEIRLKGGLPGQRYGIIVSTVGREGAQALPFPIGPGKSFALEVGMERVHLTRSLPGFFGRLDPAGAALAMVTLPAQPSRRGVTFHLQAVILSESSITAPAILRASNRVSLRIK